MTPQFARNVFFVCGLLALELWYLAGRLPLLPDPGLFDDASVMTALAVTWSAILVIALVAYTMSSRLRTRTNINA